MTVYSINPQSKINPNNIINIMMQLTNNISNSIKSIKNIILESKYNLIIDEINQILNDYLKIYYFYDFGIKNIYVQIYNQNINLVIFVNIIIEQFKYTNNTSIWEHFFKNKYYNNPKIVYEQLDNQQKNDLRYSIISNKLYLVDNILFTYDNLITNSIILKPKYNYSNDCNNCNNCNDCNCQYTYGTNIQNNNYSYVTTVFWN
jgi:hypothetical protein